MVNKADMRKEITKKLTTILSELNISSDKLELENLVGNSLVHKLKEKASIFFPDESFNLITQSNPPEQLGTIHINYKFSCAKVKVKLLGTDHKQTSEYDKFDNYDFSLPFPYSLLNND